MFVKYLLLTKLCSNLCIVSIVSVLNDPTLELEFTLFSNHTISEPDLSELVVEENGHEERERWDGEVREWDLSGTEGNVEEWDVKEDGNEGGLREESEVTEAVVHTLLSEGEVSGLADHQVSPLDTYDRDEVTRLSEFKGFSGVANWGLGDN
jgi:hypothetical protein